MASELIVQTIQGPSSGANANKVLIPSGHTLDASEGFIPPAGSVVQCVQYYNPATSAEATTSTSFVASSISKTITPKFSNSLIIMQASSSMTDPVGDYMEATTYLNGSIMPSATVYHFGYTASSRVRYAPMVNQVNYTCTTTEPLTFTIYYRSGSGTNVRITHVSSSAAMTLWEIKQ